MNASIGARGGRFGSLTRVRGRGTPSILGSALRGLSMFRVYSGAAIFPLCPVRDSKVTDHDPDDFAGCTAGPLRGPKQKEIHPEQLMDPDSCQEFVCMLCEGVIHDPTLTRCSHSFCSDCFQNWVTNRVQVHQTGSKAGCSMQNIPCPQCGQGLRKCDIVPLHHARHAAALVLQRCWSNVRIRCIHHPQHFQYSFGSYAQQLSHHTGIECSWLGNLCDYVSHISNCPVQNYEAGADKWPGEHSGDSATPQEFEAECALDFAEDAWQQ